MQHHALRHFFLLILTYLIITVDSVLVYKAPTVFYSQLCNLGGINVLNGGAKTCTTPLLQENIIRLDLALAIYQKPSNTYHEFSASVASTAGPTSSFTININVAQPLFLGAAKFSFFLIIIKAQTTKFYIDIVPFVWNSGQSFDDTSSSDRTQTLTISLTSPTTVFPAGTTGLAVIPFTTCFKMSPKTNSINVFGTILTFPDAGATMQYILTASVSGTTATVQLTAKAYTKISSFRGTLLIYNPTQMTSAPSPMNMSFITNTVSMGSTFNISNAHSAYGPSFNSKCILGVNHLKYQGDDKVNFFFTNTALGNYEVYGSSFTGSPSSVGNIFCFGNDTECGQPNIWMDRIDLTCYPQASDCPLPVFALWTQTNVCPSCTQLICTKCTVSNRSNCLTCGANTTLASGICACIPNYLPTTTAISTSASGQWNGVTDSLTTCLPDCTYFIPNCTATKCTSETFCTQCLTGYFPNPTSPTAQPCAPCSTFITNCAACTDPSTCTQCVNGYFVQTPTLCTLCSDKLTQCNNCTDISTCTNCNTGYALNGVNQCVCDPVYNNLANCAACTIGTKCDSCVSNQFFLGTSDFLCHPCTQIHTACVTCSAPQMCDTCQAGYLIKTNADTTKTCAPCSYFLPNCTYCSSDTVCTDCDYYYGLTAVANCMKCDVLLAIPHCESCQSTAGCLGCDSQTVMFQSTCQFCKDHIYKCSLCVPDPTDSFLVCTQCQTGYFLVTSALTGQPECRSCLNTFDYCSDCTPPTCFGCMAPFLLAPDGTCTQCQTGYQYVGGSCTKLQGCQKSVILANGTQICISCVTSLNFIYNPILMKCVCQDGFKEFYQIGSLAQCLPVCGDGLVIPQFQDCDDKNTANRDGCNEFCKKEQNFVCNMEQPSKCVLHANFNIFVFNYAYRVLGENKGILSFSILPKHEGLEGMNWAKLVKFNFPINSVDPSSLQFAYSSETGELLVTVPYKEELQTSNLQTTLTFDPNFIVSQPSSFTLNSRLVGVNAPLIFEKESLLSTHKNINIISTVLIFFLLLQFYVGSYVHKMIGLETIQVIQSIYFVRMLVPAKETSILNSMNIIQYSASGYENAQIIFGDLTQVQNHSLGTVASQFSQIALKKFFLLNVNFSMIPLVIAIIVYIVFLTRKYNARNTFMESKDQTEKDIYTKLRRSAQWVYDHFLFPYLMMFNLICFFHTILQLQSKQNKQDTKQFPQIQAPSFALHTIMAFATFAVYIHEVIFSYRQYSRHTMTERQRSRIPQSTVQKLEHDENNPDRPNYHPLYVLVHLIYYFLLQLAMVITILVPEFQYSLEISFGLIFVYFLVIVFYGPYHQSINVHNHFLKIYYGTVVVFTGFCYLFTELRGIGESLYIAIIYLIMVMIGVILVIGFIRIYIEKKYRKILEEDSGLLQWDQNKDHDIDKQLNNPNKSLKSLTIDSPQAKKLGLLARNQFVFNNQLKKMRQTTIYHNPYHQPHQIQPQIQLQLERSLSPQEQRFLIKKIRQDTALKHQNILIQEMTRQGIKASANQAISNVLHPQTHQNNDGLRIQRQFSEVGISISPKAKLKPIPAEFTDQQSKLQQLKNKLKAQWNIMDYSSR